MWSRFVLNNVGRALLPVHALRRQTISEATARLDRREACPTTEKTGRSARPTKVAGTLRVPTTIKDGQECPSYTYSRISSISLTDVTTC
jgi:hypothetical protein